MGGSPETLAGSGLALTTAAALCCALAVCFRSRRPETLLALSSSSRSDSVILEAVSEAAVDSEDAEDEEDPARLAVPPEICRALSNFIFIQSLGHIA